VALHLAGLIDQVGVHSPRRSHQFPLDQRDEVTRLHAVASHRQRRPNPGVSAERPTTAQTDRLEAGPLPMLPEFQCQGPRQSKSLKAAHDPLQHGGLAAAGGTRQEQVLEPVQGLRDGWLTAHHG
jgi:hypothetical protein